MSDDPIRIDSTAWTGEPAPIEKGGYFAPSERADRAIGAVLLMAALSLTPLTILYDAVTTGVIPHGAAFSSSPIAFAIFFALWLLVLLFCGLTIFALCKGIYLAIRGER